MSDLQKPVQVEGTTNTPLAICNMVSKGMKLKDARKKYAESLEKRAIPASKNEVQQQQAFELDQRRLELEAKEADLAEREKALGAPVITAVVETPKVDETPKITEITPPATPPVPEKPPVK